MYSSKDLRLLRAELIPSHIPLRRAIGALIRYYRKQREVEQKVLAASLDISQSAYSRIETGNSDITLECFLSVCVLLNISVSEFQHGLKILTERVGRK